MSLEFQKEAEKAENTEDLNETRHQITDVFPLYSTILIVFLVIVSVVQLTIDNQDKIFEGNKSVILAGFVKPLFIDGQYWRMLTGGVLHSGIPHLFFNSYAIFLFGKTFETLSNRAHFFIIFLLAVIGGNILSLIFMPEGISIGASGGVLGLLGFLTVYAFKRRAVLSSALLKNMLINIGLTAFVGLFLMTRIDNYGHLGGFLAGAIYGIIQVSGNIHEDPRIVYKSTNLLGKVALAIVFLICLFSILVMLEVIKINLPQF